jgi:hypothetical protein|mmetsp:Transcript_61604/g.101783  ORF Transcript_61604/g.101783 Transcript_61604/m.101783 type:complete len:140 (-) Transcript_61604:4814-5233(-)
MGTSLAMALCISTCMWCEEAKVGVLMHVPLWVCKRHTGESVGVQGTQWRECLVAFICLQVPEGGLCQRNKQPEAWRQVFCPCNLQPCLIFSMSIKNGSTIQSSVLDVREDVGQICMCVRWVEGLLHPPTDTHTPYMHVC